MIQTILIVISIVLSAMIAIFLFLRLRVGTSAEKHFSDLVKDEISRMRQEWNMTSKALREEVSSQFGRFQDSLLARVAENQGSQKSQLDTFSQQLATMTQMNVQNLEKMRETIQERIASLQEDNSHKLEQMRVVVDEKLHDTLEKRLGESFKLVSERLDSVHKGLGEMQSLAVSVSGLEKVLSNVKTRGTWAEVQLGMILAQMLSPEQYEKNVVTKKGSGCPVEFAIKIPAGPEKTVWLPIDAKFPREDYERLVDAEEKGDAVLIQEIGKSLEATIKNEAKDIKEKYIDPPQTTDIGILFLGTEGLYAEILRRPGLYDYLQQKYRVIITGPTTIAAFLNIVQMGHQAFAISQRASEVWELLGAVKTEFGKFGDLLDKTHKKLDEATRAIEDASKKSRTIQRKLKEVHGLPHTPAVDVEEALLSDYESESQGDPQS